MVLFPGTGQPLMFNTEHLNAHKVLQHKTQGRFNVYYTNICTNK